MLVNLLILSSTSEAWKGQRTWDGGGPCSPLSALVALGPLGPEQKNRWPTVSWLLTSSILSHPCQASEKKETAPNYLWECKLQEGARRLPTLFASKYPRDKLHLNVLQGLAGLGTPAPQVVMVRTSDTGCLCVRGFGSSLHSARKASFQITDTSVKGGSKFTAQFSLSLRTACVTDWDLHVEHSLLRVSRLELMLWGCTHYLKRGECTEKWNTPCHTRKQGCHSRQWPQPSSVSWWALRALRKENTAPSSRQKIAAARSKPQGNSGY